MVSCQIRKLLLLLSPFPAEGFLIYEDVGKRAERETRPEPEQIKSLLRTELSVVASLDLKVYFDLVNRSDKTT